MRDEIMKLSISNDDEEVAYLYLPDHPGKGTIGCTLKQIQLIDLIGRYSGPDIILDFGNSDTLIGIEILA
jgi:hypothetical protein